MYSLPEAFLLERLLNKKILNSLSSKMLIGVNTANCNNCGAEIPEEDYFFNEGLCDKCRKEISALQEEFIK
jgi:hypothetical protein